MENFLTDSILLANRLDHTYLGIGKDAAFAPIAKDDSAACAAALDHVEKLLGRKPLHLEDIIDNYRYMWEENITEYKDVR